MSNRIKVLDDLTIDKIAAGEVVEDPASVVKELVENALDAGAKRIGIEIISGGIDRIVITDDGHGMQRDDALLSFERHATSKIRGFQDLSGVMSMGFRGEALASISSVAKVEMKTRVKGDELGITIKNHGGKIISIEPSQRNIGTTIEVRDLFYNVPARRKFQKSVASMSSKVMKVISKMILAHPQIEFKLYRGGEQYIASAPSMHLDVTKALEEQVRRVLGEETLSSMRYVECEDKGISFYGFLGIPRAARKNRGGQHLFLNKRSIYSPMLSQSLKSAYATTIGTHEYPVAVVHLEIDGERVDVNVHPQKHEVRFSQFAHIDHLILKAYNSCMGKRITPQIEVNDRKTFTFNEIPNKPGFQSIDTIDTDLFSSSEPTSKERAFDFDDGLTYLGIHHHFLFATVLPHATMYIEGKDLLVVDLRALEEVLFTERTSRNYSSTEYLPLQALLFPETLEYSEEDFDVINQNLDKLRRLGIGIKPFGQSSYLLEQLHREIDPNKVKNLILDLIDAEGDNLNRVVHKIRFQRKNFALNEVKASLKLFMEGSYQDFSKLGKKVITFCSLSQLDSLMK